MKFQPCLVGIMACKGKCSLSVLSTFLMLQCLAGASLPLVGLASLIMQLIALLSLCREYFAVVAALSLSLVMLLVFSEDLASLS